MAVDVLHAGWVLIDPPCLPQKRELDWLLEELQDTLKNLKHGLEDCYALLAPVDPGSTLVLSTPRNEVVKGHITRVGTRIVKGTINLKLKTLPQQTLTINAEHPVHVGALNSLHALLTYSIDLLTITLSYTQASETDPSSNPPNSPSSPPLSSPQFIAAQLRLLSQSLTEASSLLKGAPLTASDPSWTTRSVAPSHFSPPIAYTGLNTLPLSVHFAIQESSLVLWLRSLEPADAPVNFGTKLALAIGTARRLEHDEADRVFGFCCSDEQERQELQQSGGSARSHSPAKEPIPLSGTREKKKEAEVYVREKIRVETADPSLLSLAAKLGALGHSLATARRNLAIVMGEDPED
ncbi:hypothetical protein GQ53DRAFT_769306 [Thozetella sp. PMI_491]|nr:hypothetical protein GQ53DRAFT_769306 [Thozetella sp. PMI_491]